MLISKEGMYISVTEVNDQLYLMPYGSSQEISTLMVPCYVRKQIAQHLVILKFKASNRWIRKSKNIWQLTIRGESDRIDH